MPCSDDYIQYVLEQIGPAGDISVRKMFGEYGIYADGKIFGLICHNKLFDGATNYKLATSTTNKDGKAQRVVRKFLYF